MRLSAQEGIPCLSRTAPASLDYDSRWRQRARHRPGQASAMQPLSSAGDRQKCQTATSVVVTYGRRKLTEGQGRSPAPRSAALPAPALTAALPYRVVGCSAEFQTGWLHRIVEMATATNIACVRREHRCSSVCTGMSHLYIAIRCTGYGPANEWPEANA